MRHGLRAGQWVQVRAAGGKEARWELWSYDGGGRRELIPKGSGGVRGGGRLATHPQDREEWDWRADDGQADMQGQAHLGWQVRMTLGDYRARLHGRRAGLDCEAKRLPSTASEGWQSYR